MLLRGTFLLLIGQGLFLACGYGISVVLARWLGPQEYGVYGIVYSLLMVCELCVVAGIPNALQRYVGEDPGRAGALHRVLLRWQLGYTVVAWGAALAAAPLLAGFFNDARLVPLLQIALFDVLFFSFYWYYAGMLIGQKHFGRQTLVAGTYSVSKFLFTAGLLWAGFGVVGALVGNILGSLCGLVLGWWWTRLPHDTAAVDRRGLLHFIVPNILYSIGVNLFFYIDLWVVKYHLSGTVVGFYTAASTIARIPYSFAIALTGALLPGLSHAVARRQRLESERLIRQALRLTLLAVLPLLALVSSSADALAVLFFGAAYAGAGEILRLLMVGLSLYAVFMVINTMAMAGGGMKVCTLIVFVLLPVDLAFNLFGVPRWGATGAALATTATLLLGVLANTYYVTRLFGIALHAAPLLRAGAAAVLVFALSGCFPTTSPWELLVKFAALLAGYVVLLRLFGEIDREDMMKLRAMAAARFARSKPQPEAARVAVVSSPAAKGGA
ncbi:MAG: oligosaccharide flippase family protein [candidate division KSB1 bacterium]|nr:oligosaccharide flippase family protein [candidate division KSB1 bacterium]MDZ7275987.1 oligosaccharide flippase family protein [candidate division KSB1 bacterium]MDZ7285731.1 oligosaccharide flippase family protein [candidate division KSB1 bacterium]MDZ7298763.1 oligosaccharide flippase family protein [candidate division KSB1 bacterium]MDZ7305946.1 oligosaccharide flippase family protein [candidate division KSB1 bacterium]